MVKIAFVYEAPQAINLQKHPYPSGISQRKAIYKTSVVLPSVLLCVFFLLVQVHCFKFVPADTLMLEMLANTEVAFRSASFLPSWSGEAGEQPASCASSAKPLSWNISVIKLQDAACIRICSLRVLQSQLAACFGEDLHCHQDVRVLCWKHTDLP